MPGRSRVELGRQLAEEGAAARRGSRRREAWSVPPRRRRSPRCGRGRRAGRRSRRRPARRSATSSASSWHGLDGASDRAGCRRPAGRTGSGEEPAPLRRRHHAGVLVDGGVVVAGVVERSASHRSAGTSVTASTPARMFSQNCSRSSRRAGRRPCRRWRRRAGRAPGCALGHGAAWRAPAAAATSRWRPRSRRSCSSATGVDRVAQGRDLADHVHAVARAGRRRRRRPGRRRRGSMPFDATRSRPRFSGSSSAHTSRASAPPPRGRAGPARRRRRRAWPAQRMAWPGAGLEQHGRVAGDGLVLEPAPMRPGRTTSSVNRYAVPISTPTFAPRLGQRAASAATIAAERASWMPPAKSTCDARRAARRPSRRSTCDSQSTKLRGARRGRRTRGPRRRTGGRRP